MTALSHTRRILGLSMIAVGLFAQPRPVAAQENTAPADLPQVQNAQVRSQPATGSLEATIAEISGHSDNPLWMAYQVDALPGHHSACCDNYSDGDHFCGVCRL